jgi:adenylate kinase
MMEIFAEKLDALWECKGVIVDGFPRTIAQAEELKVLINSRGQDVTAMIEPDVPEAELMTRLLKRGEESGRADDNEETIKKRLVVYAEQTAPLKDWYKNDGKHCYINGLGELDRIFADIVAAIDSKI